MWETALRPTGLTNHDNRRPRGYVPPDPTLIEDKPEALRYWARTLETDEEKLRRALRRVGPVLETVKQELGIGGVG
jgi:Protein of unknown function (DUF3606)